MITAFELVRILFRPRYGPFHRDRWLRYRLGRRLRRRDSLEPGQQKMLQVPRYSRLNIIRKFGIHLGHAARKLFVCALAVLRGRTPPESSSCTL